MRLEAVVAKRRQELEVAEAEVATLAAAKDAAAVNLQEEIFNIEILAPSPSN